jgi:cyclic pyranopterin phosphate synthase
MASDNKPTTVYWLDNSLYLNITNRCSNNCWFCFRNFKQGVGGFNLKLKEEPTPTAVITELQEAIASRNWSEVVFCGFGEPTERLDLLLEIARWIKQHYPRIPIRLDTNGHAYALNKDRDVAKELKAAGISKASVSLNGYDSATYGENCRPTFTGAFEVVLEFVAKAKKAGLEVEISAVRIPEVDLQKIKTIVESLGAPFRIREYISCFW